MPDANRMIRLQPMMESGHVELAGAAGHMAPLEGGAEKVGLANRLLHLIVLAMNPADHRADFQEYAVEQGGIDAGS